MFIKRGLGFLGGLLHYGRHVCIGIKQKRFQRVAQGRDRPFRSSRA